MALIGIGGGLKGVADVLDLDYLAEWFLPWRGRGRGTEEAREPLAEPGSPQAPERLEPFAASDREDGFASFDVAALPAVTLTDRSDLWTGTEFGDTVLALSGNDVLVALGGDDLLFGGSGADLLYGGAGNDTLFGDYGKDTLVGGQGADTIIGGADDDDWVLYDASDSAVTIDLAEPGQGHGGEAEGDFLTFVEHVLGSDGDDWIFGDAESNTLIGGLGEDTLNARNGFDSLFGGSGADLLVDGSSIGVQPDSFFGGTGIDTVSYQGTSAGASLSLLSGIGYSGHAVNDRYFEIENVVGSSFADTIVGDFGTNTLWGGEGADSIDGSMGADTLYGGSGNDLLLDGAGAGVAADSYAGGAGIDTVSYDGATAAVFASLLTGMGHGGQAGGDRYDSVENLVGSSFADTLIGDLGVNTLWGGDGNDTLDSSQGSDTLFGGSGNDLMFDGAGAGADRFYGGAGNDTASYEGVASVVAASLLAGVGYLNAAAGDVYVGVENLVGGRNADTLIGDFGANTLVGGDGDDTLDSSQGGDSMVGGSGNDLLLDGLGVGADRFDGGAGNDTASYEGAGSGLTANLATGLGSGGSAAGDVYVSIENLIGGNAGDSLIGNADVNWIQARNGSDFLDGGAGSDSLFGEAGDDRLLYDAADAAIIGGAGVDTLLGTAAQDIIQLNQAKWSFAGEFAAIERFDLGDGNDWFLNSDSTAHLESLATAGMRIFGGSGNDSISMRGEGAASGIDDYVDGGAGNDRIWGGWGNDTLEGGGGSDYLYGGKGDDTFAGGSGFDVFYVGVDEGDDVIASAGSDGANGLVLFWGHDSSFGGDYDGVDPSEIAIAYGASDVTITFLNGGSTVTFDKGEVTILNLWDYGDGDAGNSDTPPGTFERDVWSATWDGNQFTSFVLAVDG